MPAAFFARGRVLLASAEQPAQEERGASGLTESRNLGDCLGYLAYAALLDLLHQMGWV
jgi:hypothetical protein